MFSIYTNQQELLQSNKPTKISRLESVDLGLFDSREFAVVFRENKRPYLETHIYTTDGTYLTGNHDTVFNINQNDTSDLKTTYQYISVDTKQVLSELGIQRGSYKIVNNIFDNVIGGYNAGKLFVKEISPSRREIRLQLADATNTELVGQLFALRARWEAFKLNDIFDSFVLNFGFNDTYQIVNFRFDIEGIDIPEIAIKLYSPLPAKHGERSKVWISEEITTPTVCTINIIPEFQSEPVTNLAPPNFDLEEYSGGSIATDFKSWNDLLSTSLPTSQRVFDLYFSGSLSGIKLNINYRKFDNFVHYSSAVERVKNFRYKLQLIEHFSDLIDTVSEVSGGYITEINLTDLFTKRNNVVSNFDDFEKYLFFETSGSKLYSHIGSASGSIEPWPKVTSNDLTWGEAYQIWSSITQTWTNISDTDPYGYFSNLVRTDSEAGEMYYYDLLEQAEIYDRFNIHALRNTIPGHIKSMTDSEDAILFIDMLGQHFDILWTYINALTSIHTREENPKDGMPDDLLYHVASSLGFELLNGKSRSDLWKYTLGVDVSGSALQTNNNGISSLPDASNTKEVWRRLVNNLPYILKTKGTTRSIKALLSCFGIPSTILTIKEYGGPSTFTDNDHYPEYVHDKYHYAWLSTTGSLFVPSNVYVNGNGNSVYPDTLTFRFKTDSNFIYDVNTPYTILSTSGSLLTITKESADDRQGTLQYIVNGQSGSIVDLELFDDSWQFITLERNTASSASLKVCKTKYGKVLYLKSASFSTGSGAFTLNQAMYFSTGSNKFIGHYHEIRLWSGSLNDATIIEHALSPETYTFNVDRTLLTTGEEAAKPYDHLLQRFTLANTQFISGTLSIDSVHPNQQINRYTASFVNYTNTGSIEFEGFEEIYYTPSPSLGGLSLYTNKIRIESSSLDENKRLNTKTRIEKSSYDRYSLDSNKIGIYFSPQTAINEDIFNQLGYFEIDDYIGDPSDIYNDNYKALNNFAIQYWKKYDNRNDFESYFRALQIYDFTLFKYIKRLLPFRVNPMLGLVVEPNVLERHKVKALNRPVLEDLKKDALIIVEPTEIVGDYILHEGEIEHIQSEISGLFDPIKQGEITETLPEINVDFNLNNIGLIDNTIVENRTGNEWIQNRFIGKYKIQESGSYEPIQTVIENARLSTISTVDNTNDLADLLNGIGSFSENISIQTAPISTITGESTSYKLFNTVTSSIVQFTAYGFDTNKSLFDIANDIEISYVDDTPPITVPLSRFYYNTSSYNTLSKLQWARFNNVENFTDFTEIYSNLVLVFDKLELDISNPQNRYQVSFDYTSSFNDPTSFILAKTYVGITTVQNGIDIVNENNYIKVLDYNNGYEKLLLEKENPSSVGPFPGTTITGSITLPIQVYNNRLVLVFSLYRDIKNATLPTPSSDPIHTITIDNLIVQQIQKPAEIQDFHINNGFTGLNNLKYNGCKLSGPGINVNTANTIDGGPVVKVTQVNPNQIVFANNQVTTIDQSVTGVKKRTL